MTPVGAAERFHGRSRLPGAIFFPTSYVVPALFAGIAYVGFVPAVAAGTANNAASSAKAEVSASTSTIDPYSILEKVGDLEHLPRLLSTEDAGMSSVAPEELQPVEGDFDWDGKIDIAITGVYNLPKKNGAYFLLVAGQAADRSPMVLFSQDGPAPFYLHKPGSTGDGDPGDQAFSVTTCVNCSTGTDFRWDPGARKLRPTAWHGERITQTKIASHAKGAGVTLSDESVDKALKIAGKLKDVQAYVAALKASGGKLGTRVEPVNGATKRVRVLVFEKLEEGEKLYDAIEIDLESEKIVKRKRN